MFPNTSPHVRALRFVVNFFLPRGQILLWYPILAQSWIIAFSRSLRNRIFQFSLYSSCGVIASTRGSPSSNHLRCLTSSAPPLFMKYWSRRENFFVAEKGILVAVKTFDQPLRSYWLRSCSSCAQILVQESGDSIKWTKFVAKGIGEGHLFWCQR